MKGLRSTTGDKARQNGDEAHEKDSGRHQETKLDNTCQKTINQDDTKG